MFYRFFPFISILFLAEIACAQVPQSIQLEQGGKLGTQAKMMACVDQFAGTISFANFVGQSNDIDLDTIYFCFGDEINIVHNGVAEKPLSERAFGLENECSLLITASVFLSTG